MRHDIRLPSGSNIFWAEHPNATAPAGRKTKIHASHCRGLCRGGMDNEYRAHTSGGMDRAGARTGAPARSGGSDSFTIGELARESGVTLRALRFYQSKGLLAPQRNGRARVFSHENRDCLALILQGKRLGFTLTEIREMLAARAHGCTKNLPINRTKCVEQIKMLERRRREIDRALAELRRIYTDIFIVSDVRPAGTSGPI
jgi:DNA-binding transcriptional MerR regulator